MRVVFNYYKVISGVNLPFSYLFGYIYGLAAFVVSFVVFGFILSIFFFELYYKQRYYFYYNRGFSKSRLIGLSFLANLLLTVLLFIIVKWAHL